jgi:alanyl-tRNA synthetase
MKTLQKYYEDPYLQDLTTTVNSVTPKNGRASIELAATVMYPEGGGQPSDQGEIAGPAGSMKVDHVQIQGGLLLHSGTLNGSLNPGDQVTVKVKWNARLHNMRVHSAGHLTHDVLMTLEPDLVPIKGGHGAKAFLEYQGEASPDLQTRLEAAVNEALQRDLPIATRESDLDEIERICQFVPAGLPRNKALRIIRIGEFPAMPDGGVHVNSTRQIGRIIIQSVASDDGKTTVKYRVAGGAGE